MWEYYLIAILLKCHTWQQVLVEETAVEFLGLSRQHRCKTGRWHGLALIKSWLKSVRSWWARLARWLIRGERREIAPSVFGSGAEASKVRHCAWLIGWETRTLACDLRCAETGTSAQQRPRQALYAAPPAGTSRLSLTDLTAAVAWKPRTEHSLSICRVTDQRTSSLITIIIQRNSTNALCCKLNAHKKSFRSLHRHHYTMEIEA